ncbi:MAG: hypothetical protein K0R69_679 [Clostridia bacterium]|jgi:predicted metal-dependent phosphoesterase TrpH|nr:hypothetical protein [Clostridia bacterium]
MKLIDLHVHSNISDGTLSPDKLALYAKHKGLSAIALTDHDTVAGIEACTQQGRLIDLIVIPGIEFSAEYKNQEIHILGYYIDSHHPILLSQLSALIASRKQRNSLMLEKLNKLGFSITPQDLISDTSSQTQTVFTRAHFAAALYKKGYVKSRSEAFDKYLGKDKPGYVQRAHFTPRECIDIIHQAGGLAVLAHPYLYSLSSSQLHTLLKQLSSDGLDGLETFYTTHSKEEIANLLSLCITFCLFPTGGSDFHGDNKPGLDIGTGYGDLQIPYDVLLAMEKKLLF